MTAVSELGQINGAARKILDFVKGKSDTMKIKLEDNDS